MKNINLPIRIGIILFVFSILGFSLVLIRTMVIADDKLQEEMTSIANLVNNLLDISGPLNNAPLNSDQEAVFLQQLMALDANRYIEIRSDSANTENTENQENQESNEAGTRNINAPQWFVGLVYPEDIVEIRSFQQLSGEKISIYADPADEIEALWLETRIRMVASLVFLLLVMCTNIYFSWRWMKPVEMIIAVLDKVEYGDFSRRITAFSLPEFRRIGDHINHLTVWLGASKSENERLIRKSILVQEQERRYLAQELHDSLGQSVSAIKAIAVSIAVRVRDTDEATASRAKNIEEIADKAYGSVRDLMTSLRPSILDELGLTESLKQMVDDWNVHHEDTFCRFRVEGDFLNLHEEQQINVYRIIQEALTNISKYARAEEVSITLSGNEIISLLILDNGKGFVMNEITQSMGLTGIRDRVTLLRGELEINSKPGKGVSIQIEFPRVNYFRRRLGDSE